ncbi:TPA: DEAD/DEAH box helicase [Legionella pneumophila]|uniref:SNF2-related protein n=1 Tax=Legionella pneumophila TaxID=446 RepID=UPI001A2812C7|nr:DEAD/DEAH box helicase [Legionella pneumophila]HAU1254699.1 DEAD/DEAH box helicase [Legionella pneumophila]HAU1285416.1 DEAD/DEAH box helicase [Legionella pneumophila]HAU1293386.1 DEAD/DEAH box helicase [Legionella pneumophila]HAU1426935.1 DEAD/DEAH box helicase [Legionella pneumophila]
MTAANTNQQIYTPHQCAYLAHSLTLDGSTEESISKSLAASKVDMNPHQVEAAIFALRSPLSQGVILADEVGLGKTIEASLVIAQKWAERKRKILLIVPAMLRNQWTQELLAKFDIPSYILESASYNLLKKSELLNPFDHNEDQIIICSYEFASKKNIDIKSINWDLVIFDEAHKLRNIWQKDGAKIAKRLQEALEGRKKILLSATPLQNSLLELYGLVSIIDKHFFGNVESFRAQYIGGNASANNLDILRHRLSKICFRTLRRQVQKEGGISFPRRWSIVEDFRPSDEELNLYEQISAYLQREDIVSIKPNARHLVTLVIRKILASSSFAITGTLEKMIERLTKNLITDMESYSDYETINESIDEIDMDNNEDRTNPEQLKQELEELKSFKKIAEKIQKNTKGEALLTVLEKAFTRVKELGGQRKAVIFTESCRTQQYLKDLLEAKGYKGELVLLNGSNNDNESKDIYKQWSVRHQGSDKISGSKTADMKAAIVEKFKKDATILISTESGAEGVNMQFCSLLINFDLPWNPQRIEQRIGRVHRYGQKNDVVIVNFLNKGNKADERVFELLNQKLKLFDGVFGASDEVLGAIEAEISFESRINEIYQKCRHTNQIDEEFNQLQKDLDEILTAREVDTRKTLLENFDEDVIKKIRSRKENITDDLDNFGKKIRAFCKGMLPNAQHFQKGFSYHNEYYYFDWKQADEKNGHFFKVDNQLASELLYKAKNIKLSPTLITFHYENYGLQLADLQKLRGKSGWLYLGKIEIDSIDVVEKLFFIARTDDGVILDQYQCERLMLIPAEHGSLVDIDEGFNQEIINKKQKLITKFIREAKERNEIYFEEEQEKLDRWAEDSKTAINMELERIEKEIKQEKRLARGMDTLEEKTKAQRYIKKLEKARDKRMLEFFETRKKVDEKSDELLEEIEKKMNLTWKTFELFTIRWSLV